MLKLYGGARSRASIVQWYLEELGIPYEFVMLDMQNGEHRKPEFLQVNPIGKVPAIVDGDFHLWESGAILLYLVDKYAPPATLEQRAILNQWILFSNATLGPGVFVEASRERELPRLMSALDQIFASHPYLLGEEFSAADVAVGAMLLYIPLMLKIDLSEYANVSDYMKRMSQRPAYQKAIAARTAA